MIKIKRVYEKSSPEDGTRILVDRLWPRGVSKEKADIELWLKDVAPSNELRKWFGHDPAKWAEFEQRYREELRRSPVFDELAEKVREEATVTLVYGAKDEEHNQAVVLKQLLS